MKDWLCSQCGEWHSDHPSQSETNASDLVERQEGESVTEFTIRRIRNEIESPLVAEIESLRAKLAAAEADALHYSNGWEDAIKDKAAAEARLEIARYALDELYGWCRRCDDFRLDALLARKTRDALRSLTEGNTNDHS